MKKAIYILVLLSVLLASCRVPKSAATDTRLNEQKNIENNISLSETSAIDQAVNQAIQKFFDEKLNVNISNRVYDTEKPTDPETGRPPLKEETNINLKKQTNEATFENVRTETKQTNTSQFEDKGTDKSKVESSERTKTETGLATWQKILITIGLASVIGLILFIILKIK